MKAFSASRVQASMRPSRWRKVDDYQDTGLSVEKGKVCIRARRSIGQALNSGFCSVKLLGISLLPPGWDASPSQG